MAVSVDIRRLALQRTRVTEIHLAPLPEPPVALLRIPGVADWWKQMLATRERDQQQIYLALLTKATDEETTTSTSTSPDCCDTLAAALSNETGAREAADEAIHNVIDDTFSSPPCLKVDCILIKVGSDYHRAFAEMVEGQPQWAIDPTPTI